MTKLLMIYEDATPISVARHGDWSVKAGTSFAFARNASVVPLTLSEFANAYSEFPIIFAGDDTLMAFAVLGRREDENLYVDEDDGWRSRYLPAFLRQYPFVFADSEDGETLTLCLDEAFEGVNQQNRGERLFDSDGERTSYLRTVLDFAQAYRREFLRTSQFCERLQDLNLLEPTQATMTTDGATHQLQGFQAVSRDALKRLSDEDIIDLFRTDGVDLIYSHLASLSQFQRLAEYSREASDDSAGAETIVQEGD